MTPRLLLLPLLVLSTSAGHRWVSLLRLQQQVIRGYCGRKISQTDTFVTSHLSQNLQKGRVLFSVRKGPSGVSVTFAQVFCSAKIEGSQNGVRTCIETFGVFTESVLSFSRMFADFPADREMHVRVQYLCHCPGCMWTKNTQKYGDDFDDVRLHATRAFPST